MCYFVDKTENMCLTLLVLLLFPCDSMMKQFCYPSSNETINNFGCNRSLVEIKNAKEVCYEKITGNNWNVTISCQIGNITGRNKYTCEKNVSAWAPHTPNSSCEVQVTTTSSTQLTKTVTNTTKGPATIGPSSSRSPESSSTTKEPVNVTSTESSSVGPVESTLNSTQQTTDTTNRPTSSEATESDTLSLQDDGNNGSIIAVAVIVPIIIVTATAVIIALFLWRRRRLKSNPAKEIYPGGVSITNKNYEHRHNLDRRITLLNMRTSDSIDNAYTDIALDNSDPVETTESVYQTIDSLPEDQAECSSGYGHLKIQTTKFIDKNYSHFPINQTNGNATRDTTYAHTENATNEQVVNDNRDDNDNTYNKLETTSKTNTGKHIPEKQEEGNDDAEAEYNHAKAGLPDLTSANKADTYSHLNSTLQKTQAYPKHSFELFAQNAKTEREEKQPMAYDTQKESETGPYEFEKSSSGGKRLQNVGPDGYETAALGPVHDYFVLEPENGPSGTEMHFHVVEDNAEEKDSDDECAKHHQYFTLEKTET